MLFFALLLQTLPDRDPRAEPAFPRILDVAAQDCAENRADRARRYRLAGDGAWRPVTGTRD